MYESWGLVFSPFNNIIMCGHSLKTHKKCVIFIRKSLFYSILRGIPQLLKERKHTQGQIQSSDKPHKGGWGLPTRHLHPLARIAHQWFENFFFSILCRSDIFNWTKIRTFHRPATFAGLFMTQISLHSLFTRISTRLFRNLMIKKSDWN
jgi:hypothetical protein